MHILRTALLALQTPDSFLLAALHIRNLVVKSVSLVSEVVYLMLKSEQVIVIVEQLRFGFVNDLLLPLDLFFVGSDLIENTLNVHCGHVKGHSLPIGADLDHVFFAAETTDAG